MSKRLDISILQPGDVLLYSHVGPFDTAIKLMTRSRFTHVEIVAGRDESGLIIAASRNGVGPQLCSFDATVAKVKRPRGPVSHGAARVWFHREAEGCGYGYWDLIKFLPDLVRFVPKPLLAKGMICSAFVDRYLMAGGFNAFDSDFDTGQVTPRDFDEAGTLETIWSDSATP